MGAQANAITVGWMLGIGISAILTSYLLRKKSTKNWSEKKIVFISSMISFGITACLIFFLFYWRK